MRGGQRQLLQESKQTAVEHYDATPKGESKRQKYSRATTAMGKVCTLFVKSYYG